MIMSAQHRKSKISIISVNSLLLLLSISLKSIRCQAEPKGTDLDTDFSVWSSWSACKPVDDNEYVSSEIVQKSVSREWMYPDDTQSCHQGYRYRKKTCFAYQEPFPADELPGEEWNIDNYKSHPCYLEWADVYPYERTNASRTPSTVGIGETWGSDDFYDNKERKVKFHKIVYDTSSSGGGYVDDLDGAFKFLKDAIYKWTGDIKEMEECYYPCAPTWTTWGEWSMCRNTCNGGWSKRTRSCGSSFTQDCVENMEKDTKIRQKTGDLEKDDIRDICRLDKLTNPNQKPPKPGDPPPQANQEMDAGDFFSLNLEDEGIDPKEQMAEFSKEKFGNRYYLLDESSNDYNSYDPCDYYNLANGDNKQLVYGILKLQAPGTKDNPGPLWTTKLEDQTKQACTDGTQKFFKKYKKAPFFDAILACDDLDRYTPFPSVSPQEWVEKMNSNNKAHKDSISVPISSDLHPSKRYVTKEDAEYRICNYQQCDNTNYQWSTWSSTSSCSQSCFDCSWDTTVAFDPSGKKSMGRQSCDRSSAYKLQYRSCRRNGQSLDDTTEYNKCEKDSETEYTSYKEANCLDDNNGQGLPACAFVTSWTRWGSCSRTCGGGFRKRTRYCNHDTGKYCTEWQKLLDEATTQEDKTKYQNYIDSFCFDGTSDELNNGLIAAITNYKDYATKFGITGCPSTFITEETEECNKEACYHEGMKDFADSEMEYMLYVDEKNYQESVTDLARWGQSLAYFNKDSVEFLSVKEREEKINFGTILWTPARIAEESDGNYGISVQDLTVKGGSDYEKASYDRSIKASNYDDIQLHFGFKSEINATTGVEQLKELSLDVFQPSDFQAIHDLDRDCTTILIEADLTDENNQEKKESLHAVTSFRRCDETHSYVGMRPIPKRVGAAIDGQLINFFYPLDLRKTVKALQKDLPYRFGKQTWEIAKNNLKFDTRFMPHVVKEIPYDEREIMRQMSYLNLVFKKDKADKTPKPATFWVSEMWGNATKHNLIDETNKYFLNKWVDGKERRVWFIPPEDEDQKAICEALSDELPKRSWDIEDADLAEEKEDISEAEWQAAMEEHAECCMISRGVDVRNVSNIYNEDSETYDVVFQLEFKNCFEKDFPLGFETDPIRYPKLTNENSPTAYNNGELAFKFTRVNIAHDQAEREMFKYGALQINFYTQETYSNYITNLLKMDWPHSNRMRKPYDFWLPHDENFDINDAWPKLQENKKRTKNVFSTIYRYWTGLKMNMGAISQGKFKKYDYASEIDVFTWDSKSFNNWQYLQTKYNYTNIGGISGESLGSRILNTLIPVDHQSYQLQTVLNPHMFENEDVDNGTIWFRTGKNNNPVKTPAYKDLYKKKCIFSKFVFVLCENGQKIYPQEDYVKNANTFSIRSDICDGKIDLQLTLDYEFDRGHCYGELTKARPLGSFPSLSIENHKIAIDLKYDQDTKADFFKKTAHQPSHGGDYKTSYQQGVKNLIYENMEYGELLQASKEVRVRLTPFIPAYKLFSSGFNMNWLLNPSDYDENIRFDETAYWVGFKYNHNYDLYYKDVDNQKIYFTETELDIYINGEAGSDKYVHLDLEDKDGDCIIMGVDPTYSGGIDRPTLRHRQCKGTQFKVLFDYQQLRHGELIYNEAGEHHKTEFKYHWTPNRVNAYGADWWMSKAWEEDTVKIDYPYSTIRYYSNFKSQAMLEEIYDNVMAEGELESELTTIFYAISEDPEDSSNNIYKHKQKPHSEFWFNLIFMDEYVCYVDPATVTTGPECLSEDSRYQIDDKYVLAFYESRLIIPPEYYLESTKFFSDDEIYEFFFKGYYYETELLENFDQKALVEVIYQFGESGTQTPCTAIDDAKTTIVAVSCDPSQLESGWSFGPIRYSWNYMRKAENLKTDQGKFNEAPSEFLLVSKAQVATWSPRLFKFENYPDRFAACVYAHIVNRAVDDTDPAEPYTQYVDQFYLDLDKVDCLKTYCREDTLLEYIYDIEFNSETGLNETVVSTTEEKYIVCSDDPKFDQITNKLVDTSSVIFGRTIAEVDTAENLLLVSDYPHIEEVNLASESGKGDEKAVVVTMFTDRSFKEAKQVVRNHNNFMRGKKKGDKFETDTHSVDRPASFMAASTSNDWDELSTNSLDFPVGAHFWYGYRYDPTQRFFYYVDIPGFGLSESTSQVRQAFGIYASEFVNTDKYCVIYHIIAENEAELVPAHCDNEFAALLFTDKDFDKVSNSSDSDSQELWHISATDNDLSHSINSNSYSMSDLEDTDLDSQFHDAVDSTDSNARRRKRKRRDYVDGNTYDDITDHSDDILIWTDDKDGVTSVVEDWVDGGYFPLPNGNAINKFWMGIRWDSNLNRYQYTSANIIDEYVYVDDRFYWDVDDDDFDGATWNSDYNEYSLDDETKECVIFEIDATVSTNQVTRRTADCSESDVMVMAYQPGNDNWPYNIKAGLVWGLSPYDSSGDFNSSVPSTHQDIDDILLIQPVPLSYDTMAQNYEDCIESNDLTTSENQTCMTYNGQQIHLFTLQENVIASFKREFDDDRPNGLAYDERLPTGVFWVAMQYSVVLQQWWYTEYIYTTNVNGTFKVNKPVLDTHLLPISYKDVVNNDDLNCMVLHIEPDYYNLTDHNELELHRVPCNESTYTFDKYDRDDLTADPVETTYEIRQLSVARRRFDLPTIDQEELCLNPSVDFAVASVTGDPHFMTFDRLHLTSNVDDSQGYILTQLCQGGIEDTWNTFTDNDLEDHLPYFRVIGYFKKYGSTDTSNKVEESSYLKAIEIDYKPVGSDVTFRYYLEENYESIQSNLDHDSIFGPLLSGRTYTYPEYQGVSDTLTVSGSRNNFLMKFFNDKIRIHFYYRAVTIETSCLLMKSQNSYPLSPYETDRVQAAAGNSEYTDAGKFKVCGLLGAFDLFQENDLYIRTYTSEEPANKGYSIASSELNSYKGKMETIHQKIAESWFKLNTIDDVNAIIADLQANPIADRPAIDYWDKRCIADLGNDAKVAIQRLCHNAVELVKKQYNPNNCFRFGQEHVTNCQKDLCIYKKALGANSVEYERMAQALICNMISSIGEECIMIQSTRLDQTQLSITSQGSLPLGNWRRSDDFSECMNLFNCPLHSHYEACASKSITVFNCQAHLANTITDYNYDTTSAADAIAALKAFEKIEVTDKRQCKEGCVCDSGYIFDGIRCLKVDTDDFPYCPYEQPIEDQNEQCNSEIATVFGFSSYKTYTKKKFKLRKGGTVVLSQYPCPGESASENENRELSSFTLSMEKSSNKKLSGWKKKMILEYVFGDYNVIIEHSPKNGRGMIATITDTTTSTTTMERIGSKVNLCHIGLAIRTFSLKGFAIYAGVPQDYCETYQTNTKISDYAPQKFDLKLVTFKRNVGLQLNCAYEKLVCGMFGDFIKKWSHYPESEIPYDTIDTDFADWVNMVDAETDSGYVESINDGVSTSLEVFPNPEDGIDAFNEWAASYDGTLDQDTLDCLTSTETAEICNEHTFYRDPATGEFSGVFRDTDCCDGYLYSGECLIGITRTENIRKTCILDYCLSDSTEQQLEVVCETEERFAAMCKFYGTNAVGYVSDQCIESHASCPLFSHYDPDHVQCLPSVEACAKKDSYCQQSTPIDGCFCDEGYHWSEIALRCVQLEVCDLDLTCDSSDPFQFSGFVYGSSHFHTFDKQLIDFQGTCGEGYLLMSNQCQGNFNPDTDDTSNGYFQISGANTRRTEDENSTFMTSILAEYKKPGADQTIRLSIDARWPTIRFRVRQGTLPFGSSQPLETDVNLESFGIAVRGRPGAYSVYFNVKDDAYTSTATQDRIAPSDYDFALIVTGSNVLSIRIDLSCTLQGQVCGLLGNANGSIGDDMRIPVTDDLIATYEVDQRFQDFDPWVDGTIKDLEAAWLITGNYWKNDPTCPNLESENSFRRFDDTYKTCYEEGSNVRFYCDKIIGKLLNSVNSACDITNSALLKLHTYESCVYDLCAFESTAEADWPKLLCNIASSIQLQCGDLRIGVSESEAETTNWSEISLIEGVTQPEDLAFDFDSLICKDYMAIEVEPCQSENQVFSDCVERSACSDFNIWDCQELQGLTESELEARFSQQCTITSQCTAGCVCAKNYIWNGFECLSLKEYCPSVVPSKNKQAQCLITAKTYGDPHHIQFSSHENGGPKFDYQGKCDYVTSQTCNQDIINPDAYRVLSDYYRPENFDGFDHVTILRSEIMEFPYSFSDGTKLQIKHDREQFGLSYRIGVLDANGNLDHVPWILADSEALFTNADGQNTVMIITERPRTYQILFNPDGDYTESDYFNKEAPFKLRFTVRKSLLIVDADCSYSGRLCGLLGDGNALIRDVDEPLFKKPDDSLATDVVEFGNAWQITSTNEVCEPLTENENPDLEALGCGTTTNKYLSATTICQETLNPEGDKYVHCGNYEKYYSDCVFDVCSSDNGDNMKKLACEVGEVVVDECRALMYDRSTWLADSGCELKCSDIDENMIYEARRPACIKTTANCHLHESVEEFRSNCNNPIPVTGCFCNEAEGWFWDPIMQKCDNECPYKFGECDPNDPFYAWTNAAGDPHYRTFDGAQIDFQGDCEYTAMKSCTGDDSVYPKFEVSISAKHRDNDVVTHVFGLKVAYQASEDHDEIIVDLGLFRNNFKVKSSPIADFENIESGLNLINDGIAFRGRPLGSLQVYFGLDPSSPENWQDLEYVDSQPHLFTVVFGQYAASAKVSCVLMDKICGLWGNFNNIRGDDMRSQDGTDPYRELKIVNEHEKMNYIGHSWLKEDAVCSDTEITNIPELNQCLEDKKESAKIKCEAAWDHITENYNSNDCDTDIRKPKYMYACIYDLCQYREEMWDDLVCDVLESISGFCWGNNTPLDNWREGDSTDDVNLRACPKTCPTNMHFANCQEQQNCRDKYTCQIYQSISDCPTVENPFDNCREGCVCDDEYFWDGNRCVHQDKCPPIPPERNVDLSCFLPQAMALGDPHFYTFDGDHIKFQGNCWYTASKVCDDKIEEAKNLTLTNFEFHIQADTYLDTDIVNEVTWATGSRLVVYKRDDSGESLTIEFLNENPVLLASYSTDPDIKIPTAIRKNFLEYNLAVRQDFPGRYEIYVGVPTEWLEQNERRLDLHPTEYNLRWIADADQFHSLKVGCDYGGTNSLLCGIFGNADGSPGNDFTTSDGTVLDMVHANVDEFGHSWRLDDTCQLPKSPEFCTKTDADFVSELETICRDLTYNTFTPPQNSTAPSCSDDILEDAYNACLYDLCFVDNLLWNIEGCKIPSRLAKLCSDDGYDSTGWLENSDRCSVQICSDPNQEYRNDKITCDVRTTENCNEPIPLSCPNSTPLTGCFCKEGYFWDDESASCVSVCPPVPEVCDPSDPYLTYAQAYGDPHFMSFDGQLNNYQGSCSYILTSTDCDTTRDSFDTSTNGLRHFSVVADQQHWQDNKKVTYIMGLTIIIDNVIEIQMRREWPQVRIRTIDSFNKQFSLIPYETELVDYNLKVSGNSFKTDIILTDVNVVFTIVNNFKVDIGLPCTYKGLVCGLLGNYNDQTDDLVHYSGEDPYLTGSYGRITKKEREKLWGDTYITTNIPSLTTKNFNYLHTCGDDNEPLQNCEAHGNAPVLQEFCRDYLESLLSKFDIENDCASMINKEAYIESCAYDLCQFYDLSTNTLNLEAELKCQTINAADSFCYSIGRPLNYFYDDDEFTPCKPTCTDPNAEFKEVKTNCYDTYNCLDSTCEVPEEQQLPGCDCNDGYYSTGVDCAKIEYCPVDPPEKEEFYLKCVLPSAQVFYDSLQFKQFDQQLFSIEGDCEYTLATTNCAGKPDLEDTLTKFDFSFGVPHDSKNLTYHKITATHHNSLVVFSIIYRPEINRFVWFSTGSGSGSETKLDANQVIEELNFVKRDYKLYFNVPNQEIEKLATHLDIPDIYDFMVNLEKGEIEMSCPYADKVCGLFGNADGQQGTLDLIDITGDDNHANTASGIASFADTWKTNTECVEVVIPDPFVRCPDDSRVTATAKCNEALALVLTQCFENPQVYLEACITEMCDAVVASSSDQDLTAIGCKYAENFKDFCFERNWHVGEWRGNLCPKDCSHIQNSEYMTHKTVCEIQTTRSCQLDSFLCEDHTFTEGCFCKDGYFFSEKGERCVENCPVGEVTTETPVLICRNEAKIFYDTKFYTFDQANYVLADLSTFDPGFAYCNYVLYSTFESDCGSQLPSELINFSITGALRPTNQTTSVSGNEAVFLQSYTISIASGNNFITLHYNPARSNVFYFRHSGSTSSTPHKLNDADISNYLTPLNITIEENQSKINMNNLVFIEVNPYSFGLNMRIEIDCQYEELICGAVSGVYNKDFSDDFGNRTIEETFEYYENPNMNSWSEYSPNQCGFVMLWFSK